MHRRLTLPLALSLIVAACSGAAPSPTPSPTPPDPDRLLFRVVTAGGLMPAGGMLNDMPSLSLYADGRLISQGAQIAIFPGPALPAVQVQRVSPQGIGRIIAAAQAAGLAGPDRTLPDDHLADAPTTSFILDVDGNSRHVTDVVGLYESQDTSPQRQALRTFADQLTNVGEWLGSDAEPEAKPYAWQELRLGVSATDPQQAGDPEFINFQDWPLEEPLATFGEPWGLGIRCGVVSGEDSAQVTAALASANQMTHWRSGGKTFSLIVRPLLPDEKGCPPGGE
jgi:hypothetical protein